MTTFYRKCPASFEITFWKICLHEQINSLVLNEVEDLESASSAERHII
jgi:hypothetical protein